MNSEIEYRLREAELRDMLQKVKDELRLFNELVKDAPESEFLGRLKIKTAFGCIEADISHLKASALLFSKDPEKDFTKSDYLALQDLEEYIKKDGTAEKRNARIGMKDNLKLALRCFTTAVGIPYQLDFGGSGASAFLRAIDIRNRIIHPKSASDWTISKEDLALVDAAWLWFGGEIVKATTLAK